MAVRIPKGDSKPSTISVPIGDSRTISGKKLSELRDGWILDHIAAYRLTIRAVLSKLFFEGRSPDNVIRRLSPKKLQSCGPLDDGFSWYQLSKAEATRRKLWSRATPLNGHRLHEALATLWFCCGNESRRNRHEASEFTDVSSPLPGSHPYCVAESEPPVLYRVIVPGTGSQDDSILKTVRDAAEESFQHPDLHAWLKNGTFRLAVLVEEELRVPHLQQLITADSRMMISPASIEVHRAPGPTTLKGFL